MTTNGESTRSRTFDAAPGINEGTGTDKTEQLRSNDAGNTTERRKTFTEAEVEAAKSTYENLTDAEKEEYIEQNRTPGLLSLNALMIKRLYPKAYKKCADYIELHSQIPQTDDMMVGIFLYGPRTILYQFFDDNQYYINITGKENEWYYTVDSKVIKSTSVSGDVSRPDAEKKAFEECFSHLNRY